MIECSSRRVCEGALSHQDVLLVGDVALDVPPGERGTFRGNAIELKRTKSLTAATSSTTLIQGCSVRKGELKTTKHSVFPINRVSSSPFLTEPPCRILVPPLPLALVSNVPPVRLSESFVHFEQSTPARVQSIARYDSPFAKIITQNRSLATRSPLPTILSRSSPSSIGEGGRA